MITAGESPLESALALLASTPRLLVCCDFDGTISAIADEPAAARPVDGAVAALDALAALPDTWAAVVSGRALIDLTTLAGMPAGVHLVGSHGTEFEVGSILAVSPQEDELIEKVVEQCEEIVDGTEGVLIERKPASVAIHVRRASRPDAARILSAVLSGPCRLPDVHVIEGKEVIELAVFAGNKANGLNELRSRWGVTGTFFAGDDVTDESAFLALGPSDVGVKVGSGASAARWRVSDPAEIVHLLERIAGLRGHDLPLPSGAGESGH